MLNSSLTKDGAKHVLFGPRMPIEMNGTVDFDNSHLGEAFNPNKVTQTQTYSIFVKLPESLRKYLFRLAKSKRMTIFYIINALGQNLANSESCPILRLL